MKWLIVMFLLRLEFFESCYVVFLIFGRGTCDGRLNKLMGLTHGKLIDLCIGGLEYTQTCRFIAILIV